MTQSLNKLECLSSARFFTSQVEHKPTLKHWTRLILFPIGKHSSLPERQEKFLTLIKSEF